MKPSTSNQDASPGKKIPGKYGHEKYLQDYFAQIVVLRAIDVFHVVTYEMLIHLGPDIDAPAIRKALQKLKANREIQCSEKGNFFFSKYNPDVSPDRIAAYWALTRRNYITREAIFTLRNEEYPVLMGFSDGDTRYLVSVLDSMSCETDTSIMRRTLYDIPQNHIIYVLPDKELLQKVNPPRYADFTCVVLEMNSQSIFRLPTQIKYFEPVRETDNEENDDAVP